MLQTVSGSALKIVSLRTFPLRVPFVDGGAGTGGTPSRWHELDMVLVRVEDEAGNIGWGEAFAYFCLEPVRSAVERMIAPFVVGQTISDVAAWNTTIQKKLHLFGRYGITMFALSGVDIALWDLDAKRQGKPLSHLLGVTAVAERFSYASLVRYGDADLVAQQCQRALDLGYRHVKLHEIDPAVIARARQVVGPDVPLMVDANCAWSVDEAKALASVFRDNDVLWVEEPVFPPDDYEAMAELEAAGMPVGAGENASTDFDFTRLIKAATYPQPSMTKVGGVSEFVRILQSCRNAGKIPMPHTPYFGPGYFATLSLLPLTPHETLVEYLFVEPEAWVAKTPRPVGGKLASQSLPGIGFTPDLETIERYAVNL
jgi:L-alanine-DL-glutamate epimerase-like enolase superfamily enzyme